MESLGISLKKSVQHSVEVKSMLVRVRKYLEYEGIKGTARITHILIDVALGCAISEKKICRNRRGTEMAGSTTRWAWSRPWVQNSKGWGSSV